jgi:RNA polymerase sigma factor (sigma-70 family)
MEMALANPPLADQNRRIAEAIRELGPRIARFVRRRVSADDAEDILQDVYADLVEVTRALAPIDELGAWLYRVARNRIIDRSRKRRPEQFPESPADGERWEDMLPSPDGGPDAAYARRIVLDEIALALEELPEEQRAVFIAHEIEGESFKDIAAETGVAVSTLLSRKHYAVRFLRRRLRDIYEEFLTSLRSSR